VGQSEAPTTAGSEQSCLNGEERSDDPRHAPGERRWLQGSDEPSREVVREQLDAESDVIRVEAVARDLADAKRTLELGDAGLDLGAPGVLRGDVVRGEVVRQVGLEAGATRGPSHRGELRAVQRDDDLRSWTHDVADPSGNQRSQMDAGVAQQLSRRSICLTACLRLRPLASARARPIVWMPRPAANKNHSIGQRGGTLRVKMRSVQHRETPPGVGDSLGSGSFGDSDAVFGWLSISCGLDAPLADGFTRCGDPSGVIRVSRLRWAPDSNPSRIGRES